MLTPFPAYVGDEPFAFVCYAHKDAGFVYADISKLHEAGIRLWYDEGISAGKSWRAEIAAAIKRANKFVFFISKHSLSSANCLREVEFAIDNDITIVPVYLDDAKLPMELELVLNRVHALYRNDDSAYPTHLLAALQINSLFAPVIRSASKRKLNFAISFAALGIAAFLIILWSPWEPVPASTTESGFTTINSSAYDIYLDGLELMDRWDKEDNLEAAIQLFTQATTLDPGFALAYARLADALRINYALTREESLLEDASTNANEALRLNPDLAPVQVAVGRIHSSRGNIDLAIAALERALAIDANDPTANQAIATVYERLGRLNDAEASFQRALALDPERIATLDAYANFLFRQSRFEEAAGHWQAIIRLAPDHFAALVNLGSALNEMGSIPEAITIYQSAIAIRPTYMGYSNLGTAYSHLQRYPEAVDAFKQAVTFNDSDWLAWGNLGYVYSYMNGMELESFETFEHAIQLAENARQQNLRDPFVHIDLALYYAKTAQPELALQRLTTAITLSTDSAEIQAIAAEVYEILGQRDLAISFVRKSLDLGYSRQRIRRNPGLSELLSDPGLQL